MAHWTLDVYPCLFQYNQFIVPKNIAGAIGYKKTTGIDVLDLERLWMVFLAHQDIKTFRNNTNV